MLNKPLNKKIIIILIVFVIIFVSWYFIFKNNTFERKIGKWIDKNCVNINNPCIVKIRDLTNFSWDKMYVLEESYNMNEIRELSGVMPESSDFLARRIMFVKDREVMHYEELPFGIESYIDGQIFFDSDNKKDFKEYPIESAVFIVEKKDGVAGVYYDFKRLE